MTKLVREAKTADEKEKLSQKQEKTYLRLVEVYFKMGMQPQASSIISLIEKRVSDIASMQEYGYRIMNELAIILHQNN